MSKHLNILSALFLGTGLMGVIGIIVVMVIFSTGTLILQAVAQQDPTVPPPVVWLPAGFGLFLAVIISATTIPNFIAAYGLLKRRSWARMAALIVGVLCLPVFPLGTVTGIYAFWLFLQDDVEKELPGPGTA